MADSVTVEHGGVEITTNTMSEADLRAEMEAPPAPEPSGDNSPPQNDKSPETAAEKAARARDDKGRFAPKTEGAAASGDMSPTPGDNSPAESEPPARRRDDALPKHNPISRMQQALAQKAEAERRAAALEAELQRITQAARAPEPSRAATNGQAEPTYEEFIAAHPDEADPYTAWQDAKWEWRAAQREAKLEAQLFAKWQAEQEEKARAQSFHARLGDGKTVYPDFDQVLTQADTLGLQVSAVMQAAIVESPKAADLVYFLATHPEECIQLAEESQQTPVAAATVMQRLLESRLQSGAPRPAPAIGTGTGARAMTSTAKPPVTPVGSSPVVSDEPPGDTASAAEHARYWNRRLKVPGTK